MEKRYRDEIAMVCHGTMKAIHNVGGISDAEMREFEADCFVQELKTEKNTEKPATLKTATA